MTRAWNVPARVETSRLDIRRYARADAEQLTEVTARNKAHLLRFMAWAADEPLTVEQRREYLATVAADFDSGADFTLGLFERSTGALVGSSGFHVRTQPQPYLEIGYWIDAARQGEGLVTEAVAALTRVALEYCGSPVVGIVHAPANTRSAAVPERLGFTRRSGGGDGTCTDDGATVAQVEWQATSETLGSEPFASAPRPSLFDAEGGPLPWPA